MDLLKEILILYNTELAILFMIVLTSHATETATGFGSNIIAVSLGVNLFPLDVLLPVIITVNLLMSLYIVLFYKKYIDVNILGKRIIPFVAVGLFLGLIVFNLGDFVHLKLGLGIFVICLTVFELIRYFMNNGILEIKPLSTLQAAPWLVSAGIIHGIYASGGPLLVYYAGKQFDNKKVFRSTLSALWLIVTIILFLNYAFTEKLTAETLTMSFILLPSLVLGVAAGELIHRIANERIFRLLVYIVLFFAGISLLIGQ